MDFPYFSISQLAILAKLDRATVRKRLLSLQPHKVEPKVTFYDGREALPLLMVGDTQKQLLEEQLRHERAKADRVSLDVSKQKGELVAIEDVARTVGKEYTYVRASILSLPAKLAKPIAMEDDPSVCMSLLKAEVDEILNHLQADVSLNIEPEEVDEKYFPPEDVE